MPLKRVNHKCLDVLEERYTVYAPDTQDTYDALEMIGESLAYAILLAPPNSGNSSDSVVIDVSRCGCTLTIKVSPSL